MAQAILPMNRGRKAMPATSLAQRRGGCHCVHSLPDLHNVCPDVAIGNTPPLSGRLLSYLSETGIVRAEGYFLIFY